MTTFDHTTDGDDAVALFADDLYTLRTLFDDGRAPDSAEVRAAAAAVARGYVDAGDIPALLTGYVQEGASGAACGGVSVAIPPAAFVTAALACAVTGVAPTMTAIHDFVTDSAMTANTRSTLGLPVSDDAEKDEALDAQRVGLAIETVRRALTRVAELIDPRPDFAGRIAIDATLIPVYPTGPVRIERLHDRGAQLYGRLTAAALHLLPTRATQSMNVDVTFETAVTYVLGIGGVVVVAGLSPMQFGDAPRLVGGIALTRPDTHIDGPAETILQGLNDAGSKPGALTVDHGYQGVSTDFPAWARRLGCILTMTSMSGEGTDAPQSMAPTRKEADAAPLRVGPGSREISGLPATGHIRGGGKQALMLAIRAAAANINAISNWYARQDRKGATR